VFSLVQNNMHCLFMQKDTHFTQVTATVFADACPAGRGLICHGVFSGQIVLRCHEFISLGLRRPHAERQEAIYSEDFITYF
jgi:hypothetical protein